MNIVVVGIGGRMRTGKTSTCLALRNIFNHFFPNWKTENIAFGDMLRKYIHTEYGVGMKHLNVGEFKTQKLSSLGYDLPSMNDITVRELLQSVGQGKRESAPHFWVDMWKEAVDSSMVEARMSGFPGIFITVDDIRYFNELLAVKHVAVKSYTIHLGPQINAPDMEVYKNEHVSENNFSVWKRNSCNYSDYLELVPEAKAMFDLCTKVTHPHHDRLAYALVDKFIKDTWLRP